MTATILAAVENGVATLTLNRPKAMNAFDADTARLLVHTLEVLAADDAVRVLVVAGNGAAFSAGGDFNAVLTWPDLTSIKRGAAAGALMSAVQAIRDFPKPSIARVHGAAVGGGIGVMLACDFAVVAATARFGLTSVRNGLLAGIAIPGLIEAVGPRVARQLLMHGGIFDAETALRVGLVDQVVEPSALSQAVTTLTEELHLGAPSVQRLAKRLVSEIDSMPHDSEAADLLAGHVANQCVSEDAQEGMSAFLAKRIPRWAE